MINPITERNKAMKQNKSKTGTVYFTCDRKSLNQTADMIKHGDYNMFITMYGDNLPYVYLQSLPSFTDKAPRESENTDVFKGKYIVYKLTSENKEMLAYNTHSLKEVQDWFSEQIGQKVIAIYKPSGSLLFMYELQRGINRGMTLMLILADGFEYIHTEKHKEPAIKEATKLVVYDKLCLDSVESAFNKFGLYNAGLELNYDDSIQISFSNNYELIKEIKEIIEQKQDEIISLLYNGKFKKAIEESGLKPKLNLCIYGKVSFEVKEQ